MNKNERAEVTGKAKRMKNNSGEEGGEGGGVPGAI